MKAVICTQYGSPGGLRLAEVEKPILRDDDILIKTRATTVSTGDWRIQSLAMPPVFRLLARFIFGFRAPRQPILGTRLSGVVEAVGKNVNTFKMGDEVIAIDVSKFGCHAEYKTISQHGVVAPKPPSLTFEEAAALTFGANTALHFLRDLGKIRAGDKVLVHGASGAVGVAAVQIARSIGAEVTGVCSTANLDLVRSLGAAKVVDYTKEDFTKSGETYDVILDSVGSLSYTRCKTSLREGGRLLLVSASPSEMLKAPLIAWLGSKRVIAGVVRESSGLLNVVLDLASAGKLRPIIDRSFPLGRISEAYSFIEKRHQKGAIVISV